MEKSKNFILSPNGKIDILKKVRENGNNWLIEHGWFNTIEEWYFFHNEGGKIVENLSVLIKE